MCHLYKKKLKKLLFWDQDDAAVRIFDDVIRLAVSMETSGIHHHVNRNYSTSTLTKQKQANNETTTIHPTRGILLCDDPNTILS